MKYNDEQLLPIDVLKLLQKKYEKKMLDEDKKTKSILFKIKKILLNIDFIKISMEKNKYYQELNIIYSSLFFALDELNNLIDNNYSNFFDKDDFAFSNEDKRIESKKFNIFLLNTYIHQLQNLVFELTLNSKRLPKSIIEHSYNINIATIKANKVLSKKLTNIYL